MKNLVESKYFVYLVIKVLIDVLSNKTR